MNNQLNNSKLAIFADTDSDVFVRGDFAIIRNVANIKSHILASGLGELFFIPLGRILLVTSGSASLRINMQPRKVEAGQAVVIPENFYMEVLEVSTAYNAQIVSFCGIPNPFKRWVSISLEAEDRSRMNSYYDLLWQVAHAGSYSQAILDNLLIAMLSDLHGINDTAEKKLTLAPTTAAERLVQRFFDLLAESDSSMRSVTVFADRLCISPNHLSTVIRQQTGQTVMQLLNAHAILQAKVLLCHSELPIYEVSDRLGFENPPAFCRFFKRETGYSPASYRHKK